MKNIYLNDKDSLRRYFVDLFFFENILSVNKNCFVLDLGGNKNAKRGLFNIEQNIYNVIYLNYSKKYFPDIQADASHLPFIDEVFDCIVCSELLEHIRKPTDVLKEIYRVLRPKASLLITVPFMFPIHADPYDYGRYTDQYWIESLTECGFDEIIIEQQGGFFCVFADMFRGYCIEKEGKANGIKKKLIFFINKKIQKYIKKKAISLDCHNNQEMKYFFTKGCTTGFGISCKKK